MLVWGVLSFLFLVSLLIIGMRRWEGWMFASLTNAGWIIYSLVDGVRVVGWSSARWVLSSRSSSG